MVFSVIFQEKTDKIFKRLLYLTLLNIVAISKLFKDFCGNNDVAHRLNCIYIKYSSQARLAGISHFRTVAVTEIALLSASNICFRHQNHFL